MHCSIVSSIVNVPIYLLIAWPQKYVACNNEQATRDEQQKPVNCYIYKIIMRKIDLVFYRPTISAHFNKIPI